jgi:hypothetical protein
MPGMDHVPTHDPLRVSGSPGSRALRWFRLPTVTLPLLAGWFLVAAVHDAASSVVRAGRWIRRHADKLSRETRGSVELVSTHVRLVPRISVAEDHQTPVDRG